jgi:hypothetical protein
MQLSLKQILAAEINNKVQQDLSNTVEELNRKIKEMTPEIRTPNIEPEFFTELRKLSKTYEKSSINLASSLIQACQSSLILPMSNPIFNLEPIDWTSLSKGLKLQLDAYEQKFSLYDVDLWAIDESIFDLIETSEELPCSQKIEIHVEESLDLYMDYFHKEELYKKYVSLLEQSYSAYNSKQYALATFPLFAIIEGLINASFRDYEIDLNLKPSLRKHKSKLYFKLNDYIETTEDEIAINILFFRRVFYVYKVLFDPSWNQQPHQINRNWIMHGSYHYDKINKQDILKLFQLIKATEVLKNINFVKTSSKAF